MTNNEDSAFQRGFVAAQYLLGQRGDGLTQGLEPKSGAAMATAAALSAAEQSDRARALARELRPLLSAYEMWKLR